MPRHVVNAVLDVLKENKAVIMIEFDPFFRGIIAFWKTRREKAVYRSLRAYDARKDWACAQLLTHMVGRRRVQGVLLESTIEFVIKGIIRRAAEAVIFEREYVIVRKIVATTCIFVRFSARS